MTYSICRCSSLFWGLYTLYTIPTCFVFLLCGPVAYCISPKTSLPFSMAYVSLQAQDGENPISIIQPRVCSKRTRKTPGTPDTWSLVDLFLLVQRCAKYNWYLVPFQPAQVAKNYWKDDQPKILLCNLTSDVFRCSSEKELQRPATIIAFPF